MLSLSCVTLWVLYQVSCQTAFISERVIQIQRALNSFDRPESLSVSAVDPGSSFLPTEQEVLAMEQRLLAASRDRVGSRLSSRTSARKTALRMGNSQLG